MINLSKSGNTIVFEFVDNGHYLQNGTIEVPVNSLTLVTDESDMFTFKKSATNDIFVSGLYSEIGMTKSELETFYKNNMVGGAITIDSEITSSSTNAVQSSAIFDKVTINVEESGSTSGTAFAGVYSFNYSDGVYYFNAGSKQREDSCNLSEIKYKSGADGEEKTISSTGETDDYIYSSNFYSGTITMKGNNHLTNVNVQGDGRGYSYRYYYNSLVPQWLNDYVAELETKAEIDNAIAEATSGKADTSAVTAVNNVVTAHTADTTIHVTSADKTAWNNKSDFSGSYNDLTNKLSAGTNITIVDNVISSTGGSSITVDTALDSGSTNAVANSAITTAINSKVNISDNNVSAFSGVQLAIAENTYYGDKNIRTIYIKSIGTTQYTDKELCLFRFGNNNITTSFRLSGSTSGYSFNGCTITAYTIDDIRATHSLTNGVITVTFNEPSYYLQYVENISKGIGIYYTKGGYSSGQTADVLENTVYDVLTELGENLVNNSNDNDIDTSNFVTTNTEQEITAQKTFVTNSSSSTAKKLIKFKQGVDGAKLGFVLTTSATTNNELGTFEFRPNTFTIDNVQHPLIYFGHYRTTNIANAGVPQTVIGFRQYDQLNAAAYHYLMPLPEKAKTPFSLTTSFKDYYAPMGFKNGSTMITADDTGVVDLSSELGGLKLVKLTQTEYDNLSPNYDSNTLYVIVN